MATSCEKVKCEEVRICSEGAHVCNEFATGVTAGCAKGGPIADSGGVLVPSLGS